MSKKYKIGDTVFFNGNYLKIIEIIKGDIDYRKPNKQNGVLFTGYHRIDYTKFEGTEIVCKKCNELKPVAFFRTQEYNGNRWTCKTCKTCIAKQKKERYNSDEKYRESIKRNMRKYRSKSGVRERELLAQRERYYNRDKEKEKQRQAVYREKNRERIREYDRKWRQNKKLSKV